jgi:hypothetical protein
MKRIISIRKKTADPSIRDQFIRGTDKTVQTKIINMINADPNMNYDFLIIENGKKSIQSAVDLIGEVVNIIDEDYIAEFIESEDEEVEILLSNNEGALPQQSTVDQLNKIRKISKGTDIGDKISNMNKQGANIQYIQNPIDTGIESYQEFQKKNKKFIPNLNLKSLKPFKTYTYEPGKSHVPSKKKNKNK